MTVAGPAWISDGGMDDLSFIRRLRELIRDVPQPASEQFSGTGTTTTFQCNTVPINDDDNTTVTVGGANTPITPTRAAIPAGSVYVDFDTGLMIFGTAPAAGTNNIVFTKSRVKWRDSVLLFALQGGLRRMFPKFSRTYVDTSLSLVTNQFDYTLPAIFQDEAVTIASVSIQGLPSTIEPFRRFYGWHRVGLTTLHIRDANYYQPGSILRVEYYGPFQSLAGLPPRVQTLPIWYAAGMLLGFREEKRARTDTQNVAAGEQANPPGAQQNAGSFYMRQFELELRQIATPRKMAGVVSTYSR